MNQLLLILTMLGLQLKCLHVNTGSFILPLRDVNMPVLSGYHICSQEQYTVYVSFTMPMIIISDNFV